MSPSVGVNGGKMIVHKINTSSLFSLLVPVHSSATNKPKGRTGDNGGNREKRANSVFSVLSVASCSIISRHVDGGEFPGPGNRSKPRKSGRKSPPPPKACS